jgi:hypothetical protein
MLGPVQKLTSVSGLVIEVSPLKGPNRVGVLLPSPEDGNRPSFQNTAFSSF